MLTLLLVLMAVYFLAATAAVVGSVACLVQQRRSGSARRARVRDAEAVAEARIDLLTRQTIARMRDTSRADVRTRLGNGER